MNRWNDSYEQGQMPWDTGEVDPLLAQAVADGTLPPGRALELGCGTGTNARFLAAHGWEVFAVDLAPKAIEMATEAGGGPTYQALDILSTPIPGGPFDAAFDRGCFHCFHAADDRVRFAARVAEALRPGGVWLSLLGSTEGPPRDFGPPRRSARDIVDAVEPFLEIVELSSSRFHHDAVAWKCVTRRRTEPAQPSSVPR